MAWRCTECGTVAPKTDDPWSLDLAFYDGTDDWVFCDWEEFDE